MEETTQKEQEMDSSQNSDEGKLRIKEMENTLEKQNKTIDSLNDQIVSAVNKYRTAVLTGYEEIPDEMVAGNTIEEIDSSLARAKIMVEKIKKQIKTGKLDKIPAGSPLRSSPDLSSLSPQEKITIGLSNINEEKRRL